MKAADAVHQLAHLPENWDSYGAARISEEAQRLALSCLEHFERLSIPEPVVGPDVGGGIELIWENTSQGGDLHVLVPGGYGSKFKVIAMLQNGRAWQDTLKSVEDVAWAIRRWL